MGDAETDSTINMNENQSLFYGECAVEVFAAFLSFDLYAILLDLFWKYFGRKFYHFYWYVSAESFSIAPQSSLDVIF